MVFDVAVLTIAIVVVIVVIVFATGRNVYGDMDVDVKRIDIKYMKAPWRVTVETSKRSTSFWLSQNRTWPMVAAFKDVSIKAPVEVKVTSPYADRVDCEMVFTADELLMMGRMNEAFEYTPNPFCTLLMAVKWDPKFE
jgi:hypothetical protein